MRRIDLLCIVIMTFTCVCLFSSGARLGEKADEENLKDLVHAHSDSALIHARLAMSSFGRGTVRGRVVAIEHMKRAIRLEPSNTNHHLILAEMFFKSGFWSYGITQLEQVLEIDPENSVAHCWLGKAHLKKAIETWGPEWFTRAADELRQVDTRHILYPEACKQLALCYYDLGKPDSSVAVLDRLPGYCLDSEALLIRGLSLCEEGDMTASYEAFAEALGDMDGHDHGRFVSIAPIASTEELGIVASASPVSRTGIMEELWKRRDPNPATRVNERFVEHLARVAFADLHFSVPHLGRKGSETARGEVYIRCGKPLAWHYNPFGTDAFMDGGLDRAPTPGPRDLSAPPSTAGSIEELVADIKSGHKNAPIVAGKREWVWQYEGFALQFEDRFMNDDFTFPYETEWEADLYRRIMHKVPEIYEMQIKKRMNVVLDVLNLIDRDGTPYLKVNYACDTRGLEYDPQYEWPRGVFEIEIAVLDTSNDDLRRESMEVELSPDSSVLHQTHYPLIGTWRAEVPPGHALTAISIKSKATEAIGFTSKEVGVRGVGERLQISDIELRFGEEGPPNPTGVYLKRGRTYLAFSTYNVTTDRRGMGYLQVGYKLARKETSPALMERFLSLFSGHSEPDILGEVTSLWSMHETRTIGPGSEEVVGIDLSPLVSGDYEIVVRVDDKLTGQVAIAKTSLRIESDL